MTHPDDITAAIDTTIHAFVHDMEDAHVHDPVEINNGYCRWFLDEVLAYLGHPDDVTRHDAHWVHSWLEHDGLHYDAEHPHGVADPHELTVWRRVSRDTIDALVDDTDILHRDEFPFDVTPSQP